ncbi:ORF6C domain-containing protein [Lactococcus lactis]|uniref:ORF6C domain-containing protein n=1 Tax=Lactococcus lactis TaxID=1358 RepID=UPI00288D4E15|nr:ORF6C domain-containing protein [Lactococcus lactis]MDT2871881.1 ORF6C domain-containing protein [Lactococcus lactis]
MNELQITELNGQRVLTTQQIAEGYGTDSASITKNFNNNKSRFCEGKHFFLLKGADLKDFKSNIQNLDTVGKFANQLYLWTEKGALLHAKSLGTDEAWDMYDILVDTYFKVQEEKQLPQTPEQQIALLAQGNVNLNKKVEQIENSVLDLTDRFGLPSNKAKVLQKKVASKVYMFTGGKYSNAHKKLGAKVFREFYKDLNNRFDVVKYSDIPLSRYDEATEYLDMWQPSFNTTLEIRGLNSQTSFDFEA